MPKWLVAVSALVFVQACATQYIAAREPPPDAPPSIAVPDNVPPNMGRLVIETERPTEVIEVELRSTFSNYRKTLCVTPCFVDLALGPHELRFIEVGKPEQTSVLPVNVTAGTTLLRYNVGTYDDKSPRRLGGGTIATLGGLAFGAGLVLLACDNECAVDGPDSSSLLTVISVLGGVAGALGGLILYESGDVVQPGGAAFRQLSGGAAPPTPPYPSPAPQATPQTTTQPTPQPTRRFDLDILDSDGIRVVRAGPSLPLLAKGDVVLRIAGREIRTPADLQTALEAAAPGSVVPVTVRRAGAEQTLSLVVPAGTP